MKIKDRIEFKNKAPVLTFSPNDKVMHAVQLMSEKNFGAGIVVDEDNKPIGIVTERDFMRRILAKGLNPSTITMSKIMTKELKLAQEDDNVIDWLRVMSNERFRHLPVVDSEGRLVNVMSLGDFVSYTWPQLLIKIKETAFRSFIERFHLHLLVGAIMIYSIIVIFFARGN
jgi:CBS domain-containing protein